MDFEREVMAVLTLACKAWDPQNAHRIKAEAIVYKAVQTIRELAQMLTFEYSYFVAVSNTR